MDNYDEVLRFRASKIFKQRILAVLKARGYGDISEFMREAVIKRVEEEEARLGTVPQHSAAKKNQAARGKRAA